jgi:hypothetical protein
MEPSHSLPFYRLLSTSLPRGSGQGSQGEARHAPLQTPLCLHNITHAFENPSPTHEPDASILLACRPFASHVLLARQGLLAYINQLPPPPATSSTALSTPLLSFKCDTTFVSTVSSAYPASSSSSSSSYSVNMSSKTTSKDPPHHYHQRC